MENNRNILVLTTCYPISDEDISALFLKSLYEEISKTRLLNIKILAADHADANEQYDRKQANRYLAIKRYKYFTKKDEKLLYGDAILSNIKRSPLLALLITPLIASMSFNLFKELRKKKYSLIHAHWSFPSGIIAVILGKIFNTPVITTVHGGDIYSFKNIYIKGILKYVFKYSAMVNAVSLPVREEIIKIYPHSDVFVKSMGVDRRIFFPIRNAKERLNLEGYKNIILFVGRLSEKKGVEYLIEAGAILNNRIADFKILIIGAGNLESKIKAMVVKKKLGQVVSLLGTVENKKLPYYYSAADVVVLPFVSGTGGKEGLPVIIMESLLCGKRVITTPVGGTIELKNLKSLTFVEEKNPEHLADSIQNVIKETCPTNLIEKQAQNDGMRFSLEAIAQDFIKTYSKIIGL